MSRRQNPASVMVRAVVIATGTSPLVSLSLLMKLNSERYISNILEAELLPCHVSTLLVHHGPSKKSLLRLMTQG